VFIGHFGIGFAAKRVAPRASLPVLLLAPQFLDVLWPIFNAAGIERMSILPGATAASPLVLEYIPYSHSLVAALVWSVVFGGVYAAATRDRRTAIVLALCVMSHWVLDWIAHAPDMPIVSGNGPRFGLGLWNSIPATVIVEELLLFGGALLYAKVTRPRDRIGGVALWVLVGALAVMHVGAIFGPPPPSVAAMLGISFAAFSLLGVAWWIDRHRENRPAADLVTRR
jgi:hypothetical protein